MSTSPAGPPGCVTHRLEPGSRAPFGDYLIATCSLCGPVNLGRHSDEDPDRTVAEHQLMTLLESMTQPLRAQMADFAKRGIDARELVLLVPRSYPAESVNGATCFGLPLQHGPVEIPTVVDAMTVLTGGDGTLAGFVRDRLTEDGQVAAPYALAILDDLADQFITYRLNPTQFGEGVRYGLLLAAGRLAQAWSDHPDYREEYRP